MARSKSYPAGENYRGLHPAIRLEYSAITSIGPDKIGTRPAPVDDRYASYLYGWQITGNIDQRLHGSLQ
jgi:hypothetical protein